MPINNNNINYDRGAGYNAYYTGYQFNQFANITEYEPRDLTRTREDNPSFLWPSKIVRDINGDHTIQRGFMRSLVTDPRWAPSQSTKNRRLFFQFNPQILVRSVQQTVGAMNPLLQDPAQLVQPVPGTATFGFELLFNREHEVNAGSGLIGETTDYLTLPNGDAGLVSQIGVLADILVLDSITGQGISKDMIEILTSQSQKQSEYIISTQEQEAQFLDSDAQSEAAKKDIENLRAKVTDLATEYNANIGNQAFLNPLPFRVLFSSLFMVEGVATSVDVQYQKFSRNMVPTQCKVTINMYALYMGFATKDTFLTSNLQNSFSTQQGETETSEVTTSRLSHALNTVSGTLKINADNLSFPDFYLTLKPKYQDLFKDQVKRNDLTNVRFSASIKYQFYSTLPSTVSIENLTQSANIQWQDTNFFGKTTERADAPWDRTEESEWRSKEFEAALVTEASSGSPRHYMAYALVISVASANTQVSYQFPIETLEWYNNDTTKELSFTNQLQYERDRTKETTVGGVR